MKILICGHRAYAARGLAERLQKAGHEVLCFSRGDEKKDGNVVTGNVLEVDKNKYLKEEKIDVVINFILIEGATEEDNLKYTEALCNLTEKTSVKKFIHMSSISCYPNDAEFITEETPIDAHPELKGGYGAVKVSIDNYLMERKMAAKVIFMRPGFITAPDKKNALAGIAKMLPSGFAVLMGNKQSTLPVVERDMLHKAMLSAIEDENPLDVYLLVGGDINTKVEYLKTVAPNVKAIGLPKCLVLLAANILKAVHVFDERKKQMVAGLFKVQKFDCTITNNKINR